MADWITQAIEAGGYGAILIVMFLENVFPPIPSEVVMPLAGYAAARGNLSLVGVIVAGSIGAGAGALFWYWVGRLIGERRLRAFVNRHGRWIAMSCNDVDRVRCWFDRWGAASVCLGRLAPTIRTLISIPAGVVRMPFAAFAVLSLLGATLWTAFLGIAGYVLGERSDLIKDWLNPVTNLVLLVGLGLYVWRVITLRAEPDEACEEAPGTGDGRQDSPHSLH